MFATIRQALVYLTPILTTVVAGLIAYFKWKHTYWKKSGLPTLPTKLFFGNTRDLIFGKKTFGEQFRDLYFELKSKGYKQHAGIYLCCRPVYMPMDPEIIKNIIQNDFDHFMNHGTFMNKDIDPLSGHLLNLTGANWKSMRAKLTPTFTPEKMKMMFSTLANCAVVLRGKMEDIATGRKPVDIREILGCFITDVIISTAFGLECNSLKNPDVDFRKYGKRQFQDGGINRLKILMQIIVPFSILKAINFKVVKKDVSKFFLNIIRQTVEYREQNNIYRKDFMHLLLQLKNRGVVKDDGKIFDDDKVVKNGLTLDEISAQAFVFFFAGLETSSTTLSFALYELAINWKIQDKLREEINSVLKKHDNNLTYELLKDMTYMETILFETLRKYPPIPNLSRNCTKKYTIPETSITLEEGTQIFIPTTGIHYDPEYYPDPLRFDPERFSQENKKLRHDFTWLPFGKGPRGCIGLRFAMLQTKVALTTMLQTYRVRLNSKSMSPLKIDPDVFTTSAKGGIWLDIEKIG